MQPIYDYIIIGSGFGGSVSALRLTEKGYSVLILERGKRFEDQDFPKRNWNIWKYLWMPVLRCFGILELSLFKGLFVFRGSGVGGGSLVYAGVLMEPDETFFTAPTWPHEDDWKSLLRPHYEIARRMLGVARNPKLTPVDEHLRTISSEFGYASSFRPTEVGVYFSEEAQVRIRSLEARVSTAGASIGGCMQDVAITRKFAPKKLSLFRRTKWSRCHCGSKVIDVRPVTASDEARYEVTYQSSTSLVSIRNRRVET
jgi:cholesterol oxidase